MTDPKLTVRLEFWHGEASISSELVVEEGPIDLASVLVLMGQLKDVQAARERSDEESDKGAARGRDAETATAAKARPEPRCSRCELPTPVLLTIAPHQNMCPRCLTKLVPHDELAQRRATMRRAVELFDRYEREHES